MNKSQQYEGKYLNELAPEALFTSTLMTSPAKGAVAIREIVRATGSFYNVFQPRFSGVVDQRELFGYDITLISGEKLNAVLEIQRGADGLILFLNIGFSPLKGAMSLSRQVCAVLGVEHPGLFLE